jgi:preprotein translocase subunit YajC
MILGMVGETMELLFVVIMTVVGLWFLIWLQARSQKV